MVGYGPRASGSRSKSLDHSFALRIASPTSSYNNSADGNNMRELLDGNQHASSVGGQGATPLRTTRLHLLLSDRTSFVDTPRPQVRTSASPVSPICFCLDRPALALFDVNVRSCSRVAGSRRAGQTQTRLGRELDGERSRWRGDITEADVCCRRSSHDRRRSVPRLSWFVSGPDQQAA